MGLILSPKQRERIGKRLHEEVEVLEEEQDAYVEHYRPNVYPLALLLIVSPAHPHSGKEGGESREQQQSEEPPVPPSIKHKTCPHYQSVLERPAPTAHRLVENEHYRKENQIFERLESHEII